MRFQRKDDEGVPELNLIPMLDVLMAVLTFFITTSMILTGQATKDVNLPKAGGGDSKTGQEEYLIIGLSKSEQIIVDNRVATEGEMAQTMQKFLGKNPEGMVILKADRELEYKKVSKLLLKMGKVGGDRVSLALQRS